MPTHGIDIYGLLADSMGKTTEEIQAMVSSGKIGYKEISQALKNASKEGGRFYGAMEKQSHTLNGMISNLKDNLGNLAGTMSSGVTNALKTILPSLNNFIDRLEKLFTQNKNFQKFSEGLLGISSLIAVVLDNLSDDQIQTIIDFGLAFVKVTPWLLGLGSILPKVGNAIGLFFGPSSGILSFLTGITKHIPILNIFMDFLNGIATPIFGAVTSLAQLGLGLTAIVGVLGYINQETGGELEKLSKQFAEVVPTIIKSFVDKFKNNLPKIIKQGQQILKNLVEGIRKSLPSIIEAVDSIIAVVNDTLLVNGPQIAETITDAILKLTMSIYKGEPGFIKAVMSIFMGIMKSLKNNLPQIIVVARETTNETIKVIIDLLPEFIALGSEVIMALIQGLVDQIPALIDQLPIMINLMVNVMLGMSYLFHQVAVKLIQALIEGIKVTAQNLPNIGNQILTNLKNTLLNWLWQFSQIGVRLLQSMGQGIQNQVWSLLQQGRNVISQVVSSFSGGSLWNTGYNLIVGLWNGMSYMKNWIVSKAQNLAYSVMNAVRNAFRIGSPSKVFAYYGEMNMEGLSIGMASQEKEIQSQIDGMFNLQPSVSPMMTITRENTDLVSAFSNLINGMNERPIALDIRADEGIIVKKATEGFREFQRANGRLPF